VTLHDLCTPHSIGSYQQCQHILLFKSAPSLLVRSATSSSHSLVVISEHGDVATTKCALCASGSGLSGKRRLVKKVPRVLSRSRIKDDEVILDLGRSFQKKVGQPECVDEIDELTLQWLQTRTALCPCCFSRVGKTDGCTHMTCLCGCEFCYGCGCIECSCPGVDGV
jgi:hypothetical protein